jgi:predicted dienelactone hydrolase
MRKLEIVVLIASLPSVGTLFLYPPSSAGCRISTGLAAIAAIVQVAIEGYRWQMFPVYALTAGLLLSLVWPWTNCLGVFGGLAGLTCLSTAAVFSTLLPVFSLPMPTGPNRIGTVTLHWTDSARRETFAEDPRARRELMVQIWYPAATGGPRARYTPRAAASFKTAQVALVRTHAVISAPVSGHAPAYPLVIFCPSWNGGKAQNTFQAEELASHGFVVVAMDHPYGTNFTVFPDGRVVRTKLLQWLDPSSDNALDESFRTIREQLRVRASDVLFIVDELKKMNEHDPSGLLTGRLDTSRIGIFGHSFGGAVAAQVCWLDPRFRAGINMDGLMAGEAADAGVSQPFFFMNDDSPLPTLADLQSPDPRRRRNANILRLDESRINQSLATYGGYELTLQGAHHVNFSDFPLFCRSRRLTGAGPIDVYRAMRIINAYTVAFFTRYLKGTEQPLLNGPSPGYPEARFRAWPRAHAESLKYNPE